MPMSRRTMLAGSAAALSLPALAALSGRGSRLRGTRLRGTASLAAADAAAAATTATMPFTIQNATGAGPVYAFVTGQAIDSGNALMLLRSDGQTPYFPASPAGPGSALGADCAIPLSAPGGAPVTITVPHLAGARLWLSVGAPLTFLLNPGPALVEPSVTNPSDPNIGLVWDFCEFTFNQAQLFANLSFVDFASIPVALDLTDTSGGQQSAAGLAPGGLDAICAGLTAQAAADGQPWGDLIVTGGGRNLRALSPTNGIVANPAFLSGYYDDYVSQAWATYSSAPLTIDTQASFGTVTGQVSNDLLTFPGVGSFARPSAADIFSCASGPFSPAGMSPEMLAIVPRLAAALNRSTLLTDPDQPDGEDPARYYADPVTNHYARIVHAAERDGRGYAFPYDDVAPSGGADQSGSVSSGSPAQLAVTVGPLHA
jgi:hypothetical protein